MKHEDRFSPPAVGGSSLLVIFALLTLSVFALLSLNTVQAQARLSDAAAQSAAAYCEADLQAEEIYARLRSGEIPAQVRRSGEIYSYSCPISENQQLQVEVRCTDGVWTVLRWQAEASQSAINEELTVWDGSVP